ncbi:MAG: hypothetical protein APR63_10360 [Desulfuromonas sp. SDB]|nr:MAG: hypothetical protein APR63_10360 [Desulfuromonas sp. SDB]
MSVEIAERAGFCFGVKRAISMATEILDSHQDSTEPIYILGEIIHNPQTVEMLEKKGAISITEEDLEKVEPGKLILRSHGAPLEVIEKAKKLNFEIINTVCPFVKKAQIISNKHIESDYKIVIVGKKEHPEVKALLSHSGFKAQVIGSVEEIPNLNLTTDDDVVIIVQTTFSVREFKNIIGEIALLSRETKVYNTICNATFRRRKGALSVAQKVDVNIVVGGKNSSNTRELTNFLKDSGFLAYQIERPEELTKDLFTQVKKVGITGGASTPMWVIEKVKICIENILDSR